jgi:hypothetical protein
MTQSRINRIKPAKRRLLKSPRSTLRLVSIPEKLSSGGRFKLGGAYLVPKSITKITARTAYVTVSQYKDVLTGVSHSTHRKDSSEVPCQAKNLRDSFSARVPFRVHRCARLSATCDTIAKYGRVR